MYTSDEIDTDIYVQMFNSLIAITIFYLPS